MTLEQYSSIRRDGERLQIELGRALQKGEYKCKILYLNLKEVSSTVFFKNIFCV